MTAYIGGSFAIHKAFQDHSTVWHPLVTAVSWRGGGRSCDHPVLQMIKQVLSHSTVLNQKGFCPPGNVWQCLQAFLIVTLWGRDVPLACGEGTETRDAAQHPAAFRTAESSGPKHH